jgi:DNA-binding HxlR family transcriptional regulator
MDLGRPIEALIPGARGEILGAMVSAGRELSTADVGRLAGVSGPQASRVLAQLVELGLVQRHEVPPAVIYRLVEGNRVVQLLRELCALRMSVLAYARVTADSIDPLPVELAIYGSVARGSSGPDSDIDVLVVRPDGADNDDRWVESLDAWRSDLAAYAGSTVSLLEVGTGDWIARDLDASLWSSIDRESIKLVDSVTGAA